MPFAAPIVVMRRVLDQHVEVAAAVDVHRRAAGDRAVREAIVERSAVDGAAETFAPVIVLPLMRKSTLALSWASMSMPSLVSDR